MAKLRINGDSSGYVDLEAPNAASSSTLDLDQVPQKNVANTFTANNTFSSNSYFGSEGVRLSTDGSGELGVGYGQTATTKRFSVYNGTSNRFSISPEGYVTMPNQPCFRATNGSSSIGAGVITLTQADFDVTSSYNTSNGRFTAPVTGHYLFYLTALYVVSGTSPTWKVSWWKNNSFDAVAGEYQSALGSSGYNTLFNSTVTTHMAAGDYMQVYNHSSNVHISGTQTKFGGYLLQ